jgi:hypothetical protein
MTLISFLSLALLGSSNPITTPATDLKWYDSEEFSVSFQLPKDWTTEINKVDGHKAIVSHNPDESMYVIIEMFEDDKLSVDEVLKEAEKFHDMKVSSTNDIKLGGGINAKISEGAFKNDGKLYRAMAVGATHKNHNYIIYAFAHPAKFGMNKKMLREVVDTFSPWAKH